MPKKQVKKGKVFFVGAGPGDPGLLTLRGLKVLTEADVVMHDWLVHPDIVRLAERARIIDAGKKPAQRHYRKKGSAGAEQEKIQRDLVKYARRGLKVVRLKGGDPLTFGRGAEEAVYLKKYRVSFEFVPGVSAGSAVPAYAGIPITERSKASLCVFVTGHEDPEKKESLVDWKSLARLKGTIVSFMGVKNLGKIAGALMSAGKPKSSEVSVIEWGTLPRQRVVTGTLATIEARVRKQEITSPALVVIGEVNQFRKALNWYEEKPLSGKTVMVTRARHQSSSLRVLLEEAGARVLEFYAIKILPPRSEAPLRRAIQNLNKFQWVVFTSVNGVDSFFKVLLKMSKDARAFAGVKIAVIGNATLERLSFYGLRADLVPEQFHTTSLLQSFHKKAKMKGQKVLLARADIAPPLLKDELERAGAFVTEVTAYRTVPDKAEKAKFRRWIREEKIDYVTFTSSSTVTSFFAALEDTVLPRNIRFASIGPVTSRTLKAYGKKPFMEAKEHTIPGLAQSLIRRVSR